MQQTPWVDFEESIYRYRFQGTIFADREGYLSSSDVGASFHYNLPGNYGDVHAGVYNGETYSKPEVNDQKGFMVRGTFRPLPDEPAAARPAPRPASTIRTPTSRTASGSAASLPRPSSTPT